MFLKWNSQVTEDAYSLSEPGPKKSSVPFRSAKFLNWTSPKDWLAFAHSRKRIKQWRRHPSQKWQPLWSASSPPWRYAKVTKQHVSYLASVSLGERFEDDRWQWQMTWWQMTWWQMTDDMKYPDDCTTAVRNIRESLRIKENCHGQWRGVWTRCSNFVRDNFYVDDDLKSAPTVATKLTESQ